MSRKKEPPMHRNSTGVFDDTPGDAQKKVVLALAARGYPEERIAQATGCTKAQVAKILKERR